MSSNALTTFTRFTDFPAEIRHMIWAEAIHPGGVENKPLEICVRQSDDRTRPGTKPSDVLEVTFPSKRPSRECHPRFIVPRTCREAWAVNLLLYPHWVKVYPRNEQAYDRDGTLEINSQHPDPPQTLRFNGARDRFIVSTGLGLGRERKTVTVMSSDAFKGTRELVICSTTYWGFMFGQSDGWHLARLLLLFPSLRTVVRGHEDSGSLRRYISRGRVREPRPTKRWVWICGNSIAEDPGFELEDIGKDIELSKRCGYPFGLDPVMPETVDFHTNQLVPLVQEIKAGWHDWRVCLEQGGAAPELVRNGDRVVRRLTVACRYCEWKHEEHEDGQEQDVFEWMEEERRQLEAQENTEQGN